ncbi:MAG TPA: hypothetical protein VMA36_19135 [Candidatus Limnocylindria bacterium]|jgi:hypothetical protein|nr:hypothetical protein [Candidatus Limnocylindria bacterium]
MNKQLIAAALVAFGLTASGTALAQSMSPDTMHAQDDMTMRATMVCRPAHSGEKATMMAGKSGMVCKQVGDMMQKPNPGPDISGSLTAEQVNAAWQQWVRTMIIVPTPGG